MNAKVRDYAIRMLNVMIINGNQVNPVMDRHGSYAPRRGRGETHAPSFEDALFAKVDVSDRRMTMLGLMAYAIGDLRSDYNVKHEPPESELVRNMDRAAIYVIATTILMAMRGYNTSNLAELDDRNRDDWRAFFEAVKAMEQRVWEQATGMEGYQIGVSDADLTWEDRLRYALMMYTPIRFVKDWHHYLPAIFPEVPAPAPPPELLSAPAAFVEPWAV